MSKFMIISETKLEKLLGVRLQTIKMYFCRVEFNHINKIWYKNQWCYEYFTTADLKALRNLVSRKWKRGVK